MKNHTDSSYDSDENHISLRDGARKIQTYCIFVVRLVLLHCSHKNMVKGPGNSYHQCFA